MGLNNANLAYIKWLLNSPCGPMLTSGDTWINAITFGRQSAVGLTNLTLDLERRASQSSFCEELFKAWQVKVDSIDISSYEHATFVANLALPGCKGRLEELELLGKYDLVLDLGTAEHIISPVASFFNAYSLLKVGGLLVMNLPVTGWLNHGLYRFSPTFFRSISCNYMRLIDLKWARQEASVAEDGSSTFTHSISTDEPSTDDLPVLSLATFFKHKDGLTFEHILEFTIQECYQGKSDLLNPLNLSGDLL